MGRRVLFAAIGALAIVSVASAAPVIYDDFSASVATIKSNWHCSAATVDGTDLGAGPSGGTGSLGLKPSTKGTTLSAYSTMPPSLYAPYESNGSGSIFVSFLVKPPSTGSTVARLSYYGTTDKNNNLFFTFSGSQMVFQEYTYTYSVRTIPNVAADTPHLLCLQFDYAGMLDQRMKLWLDLVGSSWPTTMPTIDYPTDSGRMLFDQFALSYKAPSSGSTIPVAYLDEFRVAETAADMTLPIPEPGICLMTAGVAVAALSGRKRRDLVRA